MAPQSEFEGVTIFRIRPILFVLVALLAAGLALFSWWGLHLAIQRGVLAANQVYLDAKAGRAFPAPAFWFHEFNGTNLLYVAGLIACSLARPIKRAVPVSIGVRNDHLLIDGDSIGPVSNISSASVGPMSNISSSFVLPGDGEARIVRLERRQRSTIELRLRDGEHAAAFIRALCLGPTELAASYPLPPQRGDWRAPIGMGLATGIIVLSVLGTMKLLVTSWIVGSIPTAPPSLLSAFSEDKRLLITDIHSTIVSHVYTDVYGILLGILPLLLVPILLPVLTFLWRRLTPRLMVGADGISLVFKKRLRFVHYDEISDVQVVQSAIKIALTTDRMIAFTGGSNPQKIAERIRAAKAAWYRGCRDRSP